MCAMFKLSSDVYNIEIQSSGSTDLKILGDVTNNSRIVF